VYIYDILLTLVFIIETVCVLCKVRIEAEEKDNYVNVTIKHNKLSILPLRDTQLQEIRYFGVYEILVYYVIM